MSAEILGWAEFRCHVLLPRDVVGSVGGLSTWAGLVLDGDTYRRDGKPVLRVEKHGGAKLTRVVVTALAEVWIQEPCLTVRIGGGGAIRAFGERGQWVKTSTGVDGWLSFAGVPDAQKATIHFSRVRSSADFAAGIEYRQGDERIRLRSDGGFAKLLDSPQGDPVPWKGCRVTAKNYELAGVVLDTSQRPRRRWEATAHKDSGERWLNFVGWPGGAGGVVQGIPPYRADQVLHPGVPIDRLWDPPTWLRLLPGHSIAQTLRRER